MTCKVKSDCESCIKYDVCRYSKAFDPHNVWANGDCPKFKDKRRYAEVKQEWISVKDRLPECETEVFVASQSPYGFKVLTTAMYEDGTIPEGESLWSWDEYVDMEYDEEKDEYLIPCGWWEYRHYGECLNYGVDDEVTHWMPLPEPPKEGAESA